MTASPRPEPITLELREIDGQQLAVVTSAPERSVIAPLLLAEIALGRTSAMITYDPAPALALGVPDHGEGVAVYRIGLHDDALGGYPLRRIVPPIMNTARAFRPPRRTPAPES